MKPKLSLLWLLSVVALLFTGFELSVSHGAEFKADSAMCNVSIVECQVLEEFLLDSEMNRRFLAQSSGIGYGSLNPDRPVCEPGRGQPYGRCLPPKSNPPHRGCEGIYHCRGGN
ncbi:protein RALF-like 33 [Elaeis guineensis]|uniref:Protein RALF-like 32 n=1 Tax=Elaeis guineensis var. tenera TaxID=51953 RepID=A0A6I9QIY5_ELAGV|nr:protein RALF-like 32 [Elaeis guineensis]